MAKPSENQPLIVLSGSGAKSDEQRLYVNPRGAHLLHDLLGELLRTGKPQQAVANGRRCKSRPLELKFSTHADFWTGD